MGEPDVAPATLGAAGERGHAPGGSPDGPGRPDGGGHTTLPAAVAERRRPPSVRPALVVVGVAALILALFGIGAVLTGGSQPGRATTTRSVPKGRTPVAGTSLLAAPAAQALRPVRQPGTPPANIADALALPAGARRVSYTASPSITLFDASERFTVGASQAAVIAFYKAELPALKWRLTSVGPARNDPQATEVLAQKAGTDGWYWEVGVVVSPTVFPSATPAAAPPRGGSSGGAAATGTTPFLLELYQVNDAT
jgi:hypothetical protein